MKNGFLYHGAEIDTMGGSYGRIQSSVQWGKQIDNFAIYGALEGVHDDGFRNFSASNIRRFYGDVGYRYEGNEFHLAANHDQPGRLFESDGKGGSEPDLDNRGHRACAGV